MTTPIIGPDTGTPEWLAERKLHVTATDVARIRTGEGFVVFAEKTGQVEPFGGSAATRRGQRYEQPILEEYGETKPADLLRNLPLLIDGDCPALAATPDALAETHDPNSIIIKDEYSQINGDMLIKWDRADRWGVEAKFSLSPAVSRQLGEEGSDELPDKWIWQTQTQMAVTGWRFVDLAVLLFGRLKVYTVERNDKLVDACRATAVEMLDRVKRGLPPPIDFDVAASQDAVRAMYGKPTVGKTIDLDAAAESVWARRDEAQKIESAAAKAKAAADAEMVALFQNAELGRLPSGATIRRATVNVKERVQAAYDYSRFYYKKG
jgi:predicted phage-related endonuclease